MFPELVRVLSTKKLGKTTKQQIYKDGFYLAAGIFAGVGLNDLFRITNWEVNRQKLVVSGSDSPFVEETRMDEIYQYAIVAGAIVISAITNKHIAEVIPASVGAFLGINWANNMERKGVSPITILPF